MIEQGCDIKLVDKETFQPLHRAARASSKQAADVAKVLLDNGADIEALDRGERTPLLHARQAAVVDLLLSQGAKLDARSKFGDNIVRNIVHHGKDPQAMFAVLLKHGWDINSDTPGNALEAAATARKPQPDLVKWLIEKGAKVKGDAVKEKLAELGIQVPAE